MWNLKQQQARTLNLMVTTRANRKFLINHQVILIFFRRCIYLWKGSNAFGSNIIEDKNTCICKGVCTFDSVDRLEHGGPGFKFGLMLLR